MDSDTVIAPNIDTCYIIMQFSQLPIFYNKHTFAASMGLRAISAKNSADAEAAR
jgi:hypothetical protein